MMPKIKRPVSLKRSLLWLTGVCALVTSVVLIAWYGSGLAASDQDAAVAYREIEALGFPLGADAYAARFAPDPSQNCAEELVPELKNLSKVLKPIDYDERSLFTNFVWKKSEDVVPVRIRLKALERTADAMNRIRAKAKKPHFYVQKDWADPYDVMFFELYPLRQASSISATEAVTFAQSGNRKLARERLIEAVRFANFACGQMSWSFSPDLELCAIAARECVIADPAGASQYEAALIAARPNSIGKEIYAHIYNVVAAHRIRTYPELYRVMHMTSADENRPIKNPDRDGLPKDPLVRASLGYSLKQLVPVLRLISPDLSVKNMTRFSNAISVLEESCHSVNGPASLFHFRMSFIDLSLLRRALETRAHLGLARAFAKIVAYKNEYGKYPATLRYCGVTESDPLSENGSPFGYAADGNALRVWSVGLNGRDDGGITIGEINEKGGTKSNSEHGDIAYIMRPPGTFVHPEN